MSYENLLPLINRIAFSRQKYEQTCPRVSFTGDPVQFAPNRRAQRPPCYYYTKKLSVLERMTLYFPHVLIVSTTSQQYN